MSIKSSELAAVADEVMARVGGCRVSKVHLPDRHDLVLHFREKKRTFLFISVRPRFCTMYLTEVKAAAPPSPASFAQLLRKHLSGARLAGIDKRPNDRHVALRFEPGGYRLHCRMYGSGGFWLADGEGVVLGSAGYGSKPPVKTGEKYEAGLPPETGGEEPILSDGFPSAEMEKRYKSILEKERFEADRRLLLSTAKKELAKCRRLIATLSKDRERLTRFRQCKKWGDLCKTWFRKLKRGAKSATLPDPETGEDVTIPLSPELSPAENVDRLYKNYRKYASGIKKVEAALTKAEARRDNLEEERAGLEDAKSPEELDPYREKISGPEKGRQRQKRRGVPEKASPFRQFVSKDGFEIRVGKNNLANDKLIRVSNGNDLWFHLRDFPGSHVVVRAGKKPQLPQSTVMEAAQLALKYSSKARDKKGVVVYTHVKNLKRPKKAPPGQVLVTREKTIHARIS
jgi:predicted ribosome quality control (RQC) complex YloA/Tae2 family protein